MPFRITGLYTGVFGLFYLCLSINVIRNRWKHKVGIGDGDKLPMLKAIRIHGNFIEYVPLVLFIMAVLECQTVSQGLLHTLGAMLLLGRIAHLAGVRRSTGPSFARAAGVSLTLLSLLIGSGALLLKYGTA